MALKVQLKRLIAWLNDPVQKKRFSDWLDHVIFILDNPAKFRPKK